MYASSSVCQLSFLQGATLQCDFAYKAEVLPGLWILTSVARDAAAHFLSRAWYPFESCLVPWHGFSPRCVFTHVRVSVSVSVFTCVLMCVCVCGCVCVCARRTTFAQHPCFAGCLLTCCGGVGCHIIDHNGPAQRTIAGEPACRTNFPEHSRARPCVQNVFVRA